MQLQVNGDFKKPNHLTKDYYYFSIGRNLHARQRMLSNKISAPLPINLPSLRSETGTESPPAVAQTTVAHNWGSPNPAVSPETSQPDVVVSRAWAVPSSSTDAVSDQLDFPTAAEAIKNSKYFLCVRTFFSNSLFFFYDSRRKAYCK